MSVTFTLPKNYAGVVVVGLSTWFLYVWQGHISVKHRILAKIEHPRCHAETKEMENNPYAKKFACAQRAEANMAEQLPIFLTTLVWAGLRYPLASVVLGAAWIITRVIYTNAYVSEKPATRGRWFVASNIAILGLVLAGASSSWELYTGAW